MKNKKIYPPSTIGILGGGQLGRMLTQQASKMGYKVIVLDPTPNCPCAQVCNEQITAEFNDKKAALNLARRSDILTYEFENVPAEVVRYLEDQGFSIFPYSNILEITQNRIKEKKYLNSIGVLTTDFKVVEGYWDLKQASLEIGLPAVLKTSSGGYDGKGQIVLRSEEDIKNIQKDIFCRELIYEKFVPFIKEISIICARSNDGKVRTFPVTENIHRNNILYMSIAPARVSVAVEKKAVDIAKRVAEGFELIGVIGVEMFLLKDETILVNEISPRVHNSGHYTIEACYTSQFEQHIRAICGLPLGLTKLLSPAVMINILGDKVSHNKAKLVGIDKALSLPGVNLHFYGKADTRPGRKMGHLTVLSNTSKEAIKLAEEAKRLLRWN